MLHRVVTALLLPALAVAQEQPDKLPFRVVFAHGEGEAVVQAWTTFLQGATGGVEVVPLAGLDEARLQKGDVLVVNGQALVRDGTEQRVARVPGPPSLELLRKRPVVLIGGFGGLLADAHQLKLGWGYG
jgi:hypothetical protein